MQVDPYYAKNYARIISAGLVRVCTYDGTCTCGHVISLFITQETHGPYITIKVSAQERVAEILKIMAANSRVCICSVLVCLLPLALATQGLRSTLFSVNWTLDWIVANYPDK